MANRVVIVACLAISIGCTRSPQSTDKLGPYETRSSDGHVIKNDDQILTDLKNDDPSVNLRAANAITDYADSVYWPAIPVLTEMILSGDERLELAAVKTLSGFAYEATKLDTRLPELQSAIAPLIGSLSNSRSDETRRFAVFALEDIVQNLGDHAITEIIPVLIAAVGDSSEDVSVEAMDALARFASESKSAIPTLLEQLNVNGRRASLAARAIGEIRHDPSRCVPLLIVALDEWASAREDVVQALGKFGPSAKDAVPRLVPILGTGDEHLKRTVAFSLAQIGDSAAPAVPALAREFSTAKDEFLGRNVRIATLAALCSIGGTGTKRAMALARDISKFKIGGVGRNLNNPVALLKVLATSPKLVYLDLQHSELDDEQLVHVSSLTQLRGLVSYNSCLQREKSMKSSMLKI